MEKGFFTWALCAALCAAGTLASCSEDENGNGNGQEGNTPGISRYVIAAQGDEATYLVTAESLDEAASPS